MALASNAYLDHGSSDGSDNDTGYDSEAAEFTKTSRTKGHEPAPKRRKLSHSPESEDRSDEELEADGVSEDEPTAQQHQPEPQQDDSTQPSTTTTSSSSSKHEAPTLPISKSKVKAKPTKKRDRDRQKKSRPGVIYLSSLPPYLRPSALRNLLHQRSFSPITRLFLAPASTTKSKTKSNSRQKYSEGWIEFSSHKTAKKCVQALNAQPVGGKKGGYYRDDVWNMRYLRGMGWAELMEGVSGERREEEGRREEERRQAEAEARGFVEGVLEGRGVEGMREKRKRQGKAAVKDGEGEGQEREVKRVWRQFEVQNNEKKRKKSDDGAGLSSEAREVLGKIF